MVDCYHNRENFEIDIYKIAEITGNEAKLERIARFKEGEWDTDVSKYQEVIEAAKRKSKTYHCREAVYVE